MQLAPRRLPRRRAMPSTTQHAAAASEHVRLRIDAVRQPARAAGEVQLECFGRRRDGRVGRDRASRWSTARPVRARKITGVLLSRRARSSARLYVDLGTRRVAVLEQRPAEPRQQCAVEAPQAERVVGRDGVFQVARSRPSSCRSARRSRRPCPGTSSASSAGRSGRSRRRPLGSSARPARDRRPRARASPASTHVRRSRTCRRATRGRSRAPRGDAGGLRRCHRAPRRPRRRTSTSAAIDATSSWSRKIASAACRSASTPVGAPNWKSISPRPVRRQRSCALARLAFAPKGVVEPALGLDGGAGQPVRPAHAAGDRQRGLGIVVGHGPLEGSPEVVLLPVDSDEPGRADRRRRRRPPSRAHNRAKCAAMASRIRSASPRSASFSRPYCASVCSCVKRTSSPVGTAMTSDLSTRVWMMSARSAAASVSSAQTASAVARSQPPGNTDSRSKTRCSSSNSSS